MENLLTIDNFVLKKTENNYLVLDILNFEIGN